MSVVIASAVRTPIASFLGALAPLAAPRLGAAAIAAALERGGVDPAQVDTVLMGAVLTAGVGMAPARQAARGAGLPDAVPTVTVNKVCGSGLETIIQASRILALGEAHVVVAGGMESMSNAPHLLPNARAGLRVGDAPLLDSLTRDGLSDPGDGRSMGTCAEWCATEYALSRADQDEFAARSYRLALSASSSGAAAAEIVPVEVPKAKGGSVRVERDEGPDRFDPAKMRVLRPAFLPSGTITAANASSINDGAAALVLTRDDVARANGWPIRARVVGYAAHALTPDHFTAAPIHAMQRLFDRVGWTVDDVDLFEINEAFAVVPLAAMHALDIPLERVNVHGGAIALGHPLGASGARIVVTLLHALEQADAERGVASICIGGGEALALAVERL